MRTGTPHRGVSIATERPLVAAGWVGGPAVVTFAGLTAVTAVAPTAAFFTAIVVAIVGVGFASLFSDGMSGLVAGGIRGAVHNPDDGLIGASVEGADSVEAANRRVRLLLRARLACLGVAIGAGAAVPLAPRVVALPG